MKHELNEGSHAEAQRRGEGPLLLGWTKPTLENYVSKDSQEPFIREDLLLESFGDCARLSVLGEWPEADDDDKAFAHWDATRTVLEARTREQWVSSYQVARALLRYDVVNVRVPRGGLCVMQLGKGKVLRLVGSGYDGIALEGGAA